MTQQALNHELQPIFLKLPPAYIVRIKSLFESYEVLGEIRTLNSQTGEIVVLALEDTASTIRQIVEAVQEELQVREIPRPEIADTNDWLLREL